MHTSSRHAQLGGRCAQAVQPMADPMHTAKPLNKSVPESHEKAIGATLTVKVGHIVTNTDTQICWHAATGSVCHRNPPTKRGSIATQPASHSQSTVSQNHATLRTRWVCTHAGQPQGLHTAAGGVHALHDEGVSKYCGRLCTLTHQHRQMWQAPQHCYPGAVGPLNAV